MRYWPNPAHKTATSEAGPPRWRPGKSKCPQMGISEREALFAGSIPEDPERPDSTRYAFRMSQDGFEWFAARLTRMDAGEPEFHGYPCNHVPIRVLRRFRDLGRLTEAQFEQVRKVLL